MKRVAVLLLVCLLLVGTVLPTQAVAVPLHPMIARVRTQVEVSLGRDTAGAAVLLFDGGERVMLEGFGYADIEDRLPVSAETAFELGSLSGLFVYLAARRLEAEGVLDLDEDITDYIPKHVVEKLDLAHVTTMNDLLYGMAGFAGRTFDLRFHKDAYCFDTLEDALLAEVPEQIAASGLYSAYSAFGIGLAAYVVECASGQSYYEYVSEQILKPLGMTHTLLDPRAQDGVQMLSKGHILAGEGSFAIAKHAGRSYGGIAAANGAISTPADLALLFAHLLEHDLLSPDDIRECGDFAVGPVGLAVADSAQLLSDNTLHFGAAIGLDPAHGRVALVLTNTAGSALLGLPATALDASFGTLVEYNGGLPDVENFEGYYADAAFEKSTLVGRLAIKDNGMRAKANEDGTLDFLGMTLRQIAPGVFADAESEEDVALVQFVLTIEGEVTAVLTAEGVTYLPISFWESAAPAMLLFGALLILALYFLLGALYVIVAALRAAARGEHDRPWRFVFPWISAGLLALLALLQLFVALSYGSAAIASFFTAMSVLCLLLIVASVGTTLLAFLTAAGERGRITRVAHFAMLLAAFIFICIYWRIICFL